MAVLLYCKNILYSCFGEPRLLLLASLEALHQQEAPLRCLSHRQQHGASFHPPAPPNSMGADKSGACCWWQGCCLSRSSLPRLSTKDTRQPLTTAIRQSRLILTWWWDFPLARATSRALYRVTSRVRVLGQGRTLELTSALWSYWPSRQQLL